MPNLSLYMHTFDGGLGEMYLIHGNKPCHSLMLSCCQEATKSNDLQCSAFTICAKSAKPKESRLDYLYPSFFDFLEMKSKNKARKTGAKTRKTGAKTRKKAQILISALSNFW